ncbi:MAG: hypothetical protein JOZ15_05685 [Acidobacteria bacterium]|nr:hypothetical protein [Acidobacteriota bacterium]
MRPRSLSICLATLLSLAAAGCHKPRQHEAAPGGVAPSRTASGAAPAARTAKPEENLACKLLTRDDAEALLGEPVQPAPVTSTMADVGVVSWRCGYISSKPHSPTNPTKVVSLLVKHWQEPTAARSAFEHAHTLAQAISGQVPENVDGLGERAYWAGGKVNQLNVLAGDDWLVVSGTRGGPGLDELGPAKAAAAKILAHH